MWALFWILFETGVLIAFILLGIAIFKRTPDQMRYEAGKLSILILLRKVTDLILLASQLLAYVTNRDDRFRSAIPSTSTLPHVLVLLSHCICT